MTDDLELLEQFAARGDERAFGTLVERHVPLVYSTARRVVNGDTHLAEDVAQKVFTDLARKARTLPRDIVLTGWLYEAARFTAANLIRGERRRQAREQEALAMPQATTEPDAAWEQIAPHLDDAMGELPATDRHAILLRYFQNHDFAAVGLALGVSDDAAQKRVSRAVERLREFLARRGVTVGTSGLVVVISTNAVLVAPAGLNAAITAAAVAGTTIATTAIATATKTIAMTTLQKTLITAALAAAIGTGIYEAHQASTLRDSLQTLQQQQTLLTAQVQQSERERDDALTRLARLEMANKPLPANQAPAELLRLRGEVTLLKASLAQRENDPTQAAAADVVAKVRDLKEWLARNPGETIPELELLAPRDWLFRVLNVPAGSKDGWTASLLRTDAKNISTSLIGAALVRYLLASRGQLPNDVTELKPYFQSPFDDAILQRYELLHAGHMRDFPEAEPIVVEKSPIQRGQYDALFKIGAFGYSYHGTDSTGESGRNSGSPFGQAKELKKLMEKP